MVSADAVLIGNNSGAEITLLSDAEIRPLSDDYDDVEVRPRLSRGGGREVMSRHSSGGKFAQGVELWICCVFVEQNTMSQFSWFRIELVTF